MTANVWRWKALGRSAFLAAAAAAALWLAGRPAGADDAPPKGTAGELDAVPADGVAVVSFRFADLWNNAALKGARKSWRRKPPTSWNTSKAKWASHRTKWSALRE